jgi:hypothetical protein
VDSTEEGAREVLGANLTTSLAPAATLSSPPAGWTLNVVVAVVSILVVVAMPTATRHRLGLISDRTCPKSAAAQHLRKRHFGQAATGSPETLEQPDIHGSS